MSAENPPRRFRHYPLDGEQSMASLLLDRSSCGIYIYRFSDNSWYVGQTVNLANRHQQHLHDYRHDSEYEGIELIDMWFMETDPLELDDEEFKAVQWADDKGLRLHNRLLTGRPRGEEVVDIALDDKAVFQLGLVRSTLTQETLDPVQLQVRKLGEIGERARKLREADFYDDLCRVLGVYVRSTVPEAAATAGKLWSVSALPSTNNGARLVTLSVSNLETIYVVGDIGEGIDLIEVNAKRPEEDRRMAPPLLKTCGLPCRTDYRIAKDVLQFEFNSLSKLGSGLKNERFLDWCYRLNVELMRKSPTFHTRGFNPILASDILKAGGIA